MTHKGEIGETSAKVRQLLPSPTSRIWVCCVSDGVPRRSFLVALLVGTLLNVINQGDVLLDGGQVNVLKIILTYAVPYCVATYGAVSFQLAKAPIISPEPCKGNRPANE